MRGSNKLLLALCHFLAQFFQWHLGLLAFGEHLGFLFLDVMVDVFAQNRDLGVIEII